MKRLLQLLDLLAAAAAGAAIAFMVIGLGRPVFGRDLVVSLVCWACALGLAWIAGSLDPSAHAG